MALNDLLVELEARLNKWETRIADIRKALKYLENYGYLKYLEEITLGDVYKAVLAFQKLAGLREDGDIGPKTLRAMTWPRCQCKDHPYEKIDSGTLAAKWGRKNLTYYIERRDNDLPAQTWDDIMERAWQQWSEVADLKFTRVNGRSNANFIVSTGTGSRDGFDGPSGTLAWAQLPPSNNYNGQLLTRFDTAETWRESLSQGRGILLLNVACHEFGHLLGLVHSRVNSALMAPFYSPSVTKPQRNDDVTRMQRYYGPPQDGGNPDPDPDPDPTPPEELQPPTNLTGTSVDDSSVKLTWRDNSSGEDRFEIYRNDELQGSVGRGYTTATDTQVPTGTHKYKIKVVRGDQEAWSDEITVTVGSEPPSDDLVIKISGEIESIDIPGYRVTPIG